MDNNSQAQREIDELAERSSGLTRRNFTKTALFAIPALSALSVSHQALGQTGSGGRGGPGSKKRPSKKTGNGKKSAGKKRPSRRL